MKIILLGAPGAGKGTQAGYLSNVLKIPAISTGEMLRAAMRQETAAGLRAKPYVEAGNLVPDEIIIDIVRKRLEDPDCAGGYILDGVPRTLAQAEALESAGLRFDHVVFMEVSDETILDRIGGRRVCGRCGSTYHLTNLPPKTEGVCDACGGELIRRKDDDPEVVKARLRTYHRETEPLLEFYRARRLLRPVETEGSVKENMNMILRAIGVEE